MVDHSTHNPKIEGLNPAIDARGQYYKTYYGRNLQIFVIS